MNLLTTILPSNMLSTMSYEPLIPTGMVYGGARGVMVIVVGNGHGDMSSNPGRDWLRFT